MLATNWFQVNHFAAVGWSCASGTTLSNPFVHPNVFLRRSVPGEVLAHAIAHELLPRIPVAEGPKRFFDREQQSFAVVVRELEASTLAGPRVPVFNGVVEAAGGADDRDRAVAQTIHLVQAARLEVRRHDEKIARSLDAMRQRLVVAKTHGDLVHSEDLETVMKSVNHSQTGLVWDIANMWTITKEPPAQVYDKLKKYIRHAHIKDAKLVNGEPQYVFLGQGEVPIFEAIDLLQKGGYKGFYSFEWEKLWHPELAAPELALADYPEAMKKHFT